MGAYTITDAFAYVGGYDFSGDSNELACDIAHNVNTANVMGSHWQRNILGVSRVDWRMAGYWNVTDAQQDNTTWADLGVVDRVVTFGPGTTAEGDPAYMFKALHTQYQFGGTHGEVAPFSASASGSNGHGVVRGKLLKGKGNVSATGATGTGLQLGAVASGEYLYATLHVFSPGTTITVVVESDDNSNFTSATTRGTIGPVTTQGATWMTRVAGPITDDWWRFRVTSITGTFNLAGAVGIQ